MAIDRTAELYAAISRSGYYPDIVADGLRDALAGEEVGAFVAHHEPTFDRDEIRRHMTVLVLTDTRIVLLHTDEHAPDDLVPRPYTSTTSEAVSLERVASVVVSRIVSTAGKLEEAVLTIGWGAVARVDLEPARCDDPSCEADHGYTGSISGDDFSLRLATAGDGGHAVEELLAFARHLSTVTSRPSALGRG
ncbi:DUF5998 family protein [Aeromicrobium alkaliterrae]|uniref:DUF5998 family protein n=1 Tax=Aeromicrobium alkaliterrae TaxID=302168 RepID=A0ABP4VIH6_9ACTN